MKIRQGRRHNNDLIGAAALHPTFVENLNSINQPNDQVIDSAERATMTLFEGFDDLRIDAGDVTISVRKSGTGPPLLLLHGHPQTHLMWHVVAPLLAKDFTVVAADLRGYGESSKPPTTADHAPYSKRAMALDQVAVMRSLGFDRFGVAGHDRGGRVGYRMAIDHPDVVTKLAVLDIVPTGEAYRRADMAFGLGYFHWFFLAQPAPFPENLIGCNPDNYYFRGNRALFHPEALAGYLRAVHDPETIHAMCEDYRAGASIDFALDEADRDRQPITCPVLVLWGARASVAKWYDVLEIWRGWAADLHGRALDCGHYLAEEAASETYEELRAFFGA